MKMRVGHLLFYSVCLIVATAMRAEQVAFVSDGTACCTSASGEWQMVDGVLTGTGMGNLLIGNFAFKWEKGLGVEVELSLDKLDGTAASVMIGKNNFLLDAREGLLYEAPGMESQAFSFPEGVQAGRFFNSFIEISQDDSAVWYINGKKIGQIPHVLIEDGWTCALRPHRNCMRVKKWTVDCALSHKTGQELEVASEIKQRHYMTCPVEKHIIPVDNDSCLTLPFCQPAEIGICECTMRALPEGQEISWEVTVADGGQMQLSGDKLRLVFAGSKNDRMVKPAEMVLRKAGKIIRKRRLGLYESKTSGNFPKGEVRVVNGYAEKYLDGKPVGTISNRLGRAYGQHFFATPVQNFGRAGVDGNIVLVDPYLFMTGEDFAFDYEAFLDDFEAYALRTIAENPNARFQLHWQLMMPPAWGDCHPDELIGLDNDVNTLWYPPEHKRQPSYASLAWRNTAADILSKTVRKLQKSPWADRIAELRVLYGNCGEWNHWGYQEKALTDFSKPMQRAFSDWLQKKYISVEKLRKAWDNQEVSFDCDSLIPDRKARFAAKGTFRLGGKKDQPVVDYYEFFQQCSAQTIEFFTRTAKEASDGRLLVGSYYGYYWGHIASAPYHSLDSGNFGVKYLLDSPWIDFFGGPYPYGNRREGCEINGVPRSLALHGKIWESEGDMRTHRSGKEHIEYGTTDNLEESIEIAKRDYALNRSSGACYYFFDFVEDWYDDPEFMETVSKLTEIDDFLRGRKDSFKRQIAMIVSEETVPHLSNAESPWLWRITEGERNYHPRLGRPYDLFLESDLDKINLGQYSVVIFVNSYYASDNTIRLVNEKVLQNGRKAIFYYGAGVISPDNVYDMQRAEKLTKIRMTFDEQTDDKIVRLINGKVQLESGAGVPRIAISDSNATVFAQFADGVAAGAVKKLDNGSESIVISHPCPNDDFMRDVLSQCGVTNYEVKGQAQCYFAGPMLAVYSRQEQECEFLMPEAAELVADFFTKEILAENTKTFTLTCPAIPCTRLLFVGSRMDWQAFLNGK